MLFVGSGDLSQSMGPLPSAPFGQERPPTVQDAVAALATNRAADKIAGTLAFEHEVERSVAAGAQFL